MPTLTITLPRPHPAQAQILRDAKRFNVVACGRRFGKTTMGLHRLSAPALEGYPTAWFAPTFKYLAEAWRDFNRVLRPVIAKKNETERRIELVTGGVIDFWSLEDPDAGRSRKYKRIVIDEAAKVRHLEAAWNQAIRATLTDMKGDADFYSTPKGHDFFWKAFARGQDASEVDWACWQRPTTDNPFIDPDEVEAARRQLPERVFAQEYLATFLTDAGGVFRNVANSIDRGRCGSRKVPDPGKQYSIGVDLARVEDFTVVTAVDSDGRQVFYERFNQISWERQIGSIVTACKPFRAVVYVDCTGVGDPIFERLLNAGLDVQPYQFTHASKGRLIDHLAMQLEQGKLRLMDIPEQENELTAYAYELTPSRNVRMGAPEGMHDDTVIALALAAWGAGGAGTYSAGAF
jgi:Terminase large subunit, T4likevirus-type, N-terminal